MSLAWSMIWPILMVVGSNVVYHICTKSVPQEIDSFASLTVTYLVAAACSLVMFFLTNAQHELKVELAKANWTTYVLGIAIVGLEFGVMSVYRAGWKISEGQLVYSTLLTVVLLVIGVLLYKETITTRQVIGIAACVMGLFLITK